MEKLLKLFKNKQYDQLLKKLTFLEEGKDNFYEKTILKVKVLIKLKKFDEAENIINTELNMPYVPSDFEEKLEELKLDIIAKKPFKDNLVVVSEKQLEKALFREGDVNIALNLIAQASKLNLKPYLNLFLKYLLWDKGDDNTKSIIMFTLKDANIAGEFEVLKNGVKYLFKPIELVNTNETEAFIIAKEIVDQAFFQEVSKQEIANYLIFTKLFSTCPKQTTKPEAKQIALKVIDEVKISFT